jgi:T5SS/PEP-CTERM-associated repeat protein
MTLADPGTAWTSGYAYVGQSGTGTLNIQNGAALTGFVDIQQGIVTVTGPGSSLTGVHNVGQYSGNGTLTIQNGASVSGGGFLYVGEFGTGALTVTGAGSSLTTSGQLVVGHGSNLNGGIDGSGTVTIQSGAHVNTDSVAISTPNLGSSGTVLVTGAGSQWNTSGLGISANGSLTIQNGGVVNADRMNAGGTTTVTGTGAQLNTRGIQVGASVPGTLGTLTIQNGGVLNSTSGADIGWYGGAGSVLVTGARAQWNAPSVDIGNGAVSSLTINNGGVVNGGAFTISGGLTGTSVLIDGSGSQLIVTDLSLRDSSFTIQNGGFASSSNATIGSYLSASATVTGTGALWKNSGDFNLAHGSLSISDGAQVTNANASVGYYQAGFNSSVIIDDATWTNIGTLDIGINDPGCVTVQNSGVLKAGGTIVGSLGCLIFDRSVGYINGAFTLDPGGSLTLDIAGFDPGLFGQLDISDFGLFAGTIDIDFINGFVPREGESFDLINALRGFDFSNASVQIEGIPAGFQLEETFQNGELLITASSPEPGSLYLFATVLIAFITIGMWRKRMNRRTA